VALTRFDLEGNILTRRSEGTFMPIRREFDGEAWQIPKKWYNSPLFFRKRSPRMNTRMSLRRTAALGLVLILSLAAVPLAAQRQQPPEYKEVVAATRIQDASARLKEFERLKTAFPNSVMMATIDMYIQTSKVELADTLDAVLALQKDFLAKSQGPARLQNPLMASAQILTHPLIKTFDKDKVVAAVLQYRDMSSKIAADAAVFQGVPEEQRNDYKTYVLNMFSLRTAQAYLNAENQVKAMAALGAYRKDGGSPDALYSYTLGAALALQNKPAEAYNAYLSAAVENYEDSTAKARALFERINGKADGFEAALEAKLKALPYHAEPFKPAADWKGKAVLAEIFTGSECPPCVAADLGFDGLIESYPAKYLAVLEYHLPIPRPDPIMNPASQMRQDYYGVTSTPTIVIDGDKKIVGGGSRGMAESKFKQYKSEIDARVNSAPGFALKAKAARTGDAVKVECEFGDPGQAIEVNVVLVQDRENYKGSNGLAVHKMVVRDLAVFPAGAHAATFDLAASEQGTNRYLTEFENTSTRFAGYKFAERHAAIARQELRIVVFAQEKSTKKVLQAVVVEVK
jgi:thiol-disulfide isomerase/thioredoxin